jgi:hypothetical protein
MTRSTPVSPNPAVPLDLALVAQRILKLAEISVLEHLESLDRSQAVKLSNIFQGHDDNADSAER